MNRDNDTTQIVWGDQHEAFTEVRWPEARERLRLYLNLSEALAEDALCALFTGRVVT